MCVIFNLYVTFATSTFVSPVTLLEWELRGALATPEFGGLEKITFRKRQSKTYCYLVLSGIKILTRALQRF